MVLADRLPVVRADALTTEVPRRLLLDRLSVSAATVVVISGPAGSGKSTLLRQWSGSDPRPHVRIPLSARHDDPALLARALVEALGAIGPDEPAAVAAVTADEPTYSSVVVPGMAELAGSRARDYVLVLDDLHLVGGREAHQLVRSLADSVPSGSALVVATRAAAPTWVARLVASDRVLLVGPRELAFDTVEAALLSDAFGLPVSDAADLLDQTDGWAVALHLAALARAASADRSRRAAERGGEDVVHDFIRSEVLDPLPAEHRDLLVRCSIVETMTPDLCDRLLGRDDSALLLHDVVRRTLLVQEVDGAFRPHHLLLDTVGKERSATLRADELAALHASASGWFAEHGDPESTAAHALLAGDLDTVAQVVWRSVPGSAGSGRSDRLTRLLAGLTEDQIASDRWLCLAAAWATLQRGDADERERWSLRSESHAGPGWRERVRTDVYAASLAAMIAVAGRDGVARTSRLCEDALAGLPADDPFRCPASFVLGATRALLEHPDVDAPLEDSRRWARALGVAVNEADSLAFSGMLALMRGDVATGTRLIDAGAAVVTEQNADRLSTAAHPLTAYALSLALQGRRAESARTLAQARRLTLQLHGIAPWFQVMGRVIQARTALLLGDVALAGQLVTEARAEYTSDLDATTLPGLLTDTEAMLREQATTGSAAGTLTAAELRVLAFLPSHLTFPQIGEHLFLSASTVKTHALAIYRKLGVSSRSEAVDVARRLGLVEASLRG